MKNGAAIPPPGAMPPGMMMPGMPGMPMPGSKFLLGYKDDSIVYAQVVSLLRCYSLLHILNGDLRNY